MSKFILINFFSFLCFAETIPFKVKTTTYKVVPVPQAMAMATKDPKGGDSFSMTQVEEKESVVKIATDKIGAAIEEVRKNVCKTIKNGSIKIWFKGTETGKLLLVETSGEAGIEVQLNCVNGE